MTDGRRCCCARLQIVSSSYAAAAYLKDIGFSSKVLLLGPVGVELELQQAGIEYVGGEGWQVPLQDTADAMLGLQVRRAPPGARQACRGQLPRAWA